MKTPSMTPMKTAPVPPAPPADNEHVAEGAEKFSEKPAKKAKADLPTVGDIVIRDGLPMIVTEVGDETFGGQVFGKGTEVTDVEGATLGDKPGQCQRK